MKPSRLIFLLCLPATLVGRPVLGVGPDRPSAWQLRDHAQVDSRGIFLEQLVERPTPTTNELRLAAAPAPGQTVTLTRTQITEAARRLDPAFLVTNWSGAAQVVVARRLRPLDEDDLKQRLTAALDELPARIPGELELSFTRPWTPVNVPDEPLTVRVLDLPAAGLTPNFILRFELRTARESAGIWQVPLQAHRWGQVWVARTSQPRGMPLRQADLTQERRDLLTLRDALLKPDFENDSLELAETLPAGTPLLGRSVRARPVVLRGRLVEAVFEQGPLVITVKAEALEDGLPGQVIRARNPLSKREFRGKVQNEQTILVSL